MQHLSDYHHVLAQTNELALATAVNNIPNVRIVNFVYDEQNPGILYFASDRENQKVREFGQNPHVAFTTVPKEGIFHVRSHHAAVEKSSYAIGDLKELFVSKIPGYDETIEAIGEMLDVFEIRIKEASIISGFEEPKHISF